MQAASSADIPYNFGASNIDHEDPPTRDNFRIDWSTTNREPWNKAAIEILTDYVREMHPAEWDGVSRKKTRLKVRKHIEHLRNYRKARQRARRRAELSLKDSARSRQRSVRAATTRFLSSVLTPNL